jgi:hypothetical protein
LLIRLINETKRNKTALRRKTVNGLRRFPEGAHI